MAKSGCREPAPVTQGWYRYAISIACSPTGGYEWRVLRKPECTGKRVPEPEAVVVSRGTAVNCDEAQRRGAAARATVMAQYRGRDALWPGADAAPGA